MDGSRESEDIISLVQCQLTPNAEVVLRHVIPPGKSLAVGLFVLTGETQEEEAQRYKAMSYLQGIIGRMGLDPEQWRCEVVVAEFVARRIVDFPISQEVHRIAMYTHDRKGLAKIIKGSIARNVQRNSPNRSKGDQTDGSGGRDLGKRRETIMVNGIAELRQN